MAHHSHSRSGPTDLIGQVLSALCAVHCVTAPLWMTLAPAATSVLGGAHPVLLVLVIGVALWAFVPGYRCHRSNLVAGLAIGGVGLLVVAAFSFEGRLLLESAVSVMGATMMVAAHWQNRRLLQVAHHHAH